MSDTGNTWSKRAAEWRLDDIQSDVNDLFARSDANTEMLEDIQEKLEHLETFIPEMVRVTDHNAGEVKKLFYAHYRQCELTDKLITHINQQRDAILKLADALTRLARPPSNSTGDIFSNLARQSPAPKAPKTRKSKLHIVKDDEATP